VRALVGFRPCGCPAFAVRLDSHVNPDDIEGLDGRQYRWLPLDEARQITTVCVHEGTGA
jgi:hypothetical protein